GHVYSTANCEPRTANDYCPDDCAVGLLKWAAIRTNASSPNSSARASGSTSDFCNASSTRWRLSKAVKLLTSFLRRIRNAVLMIEINSSLAYGFRAASRTTTALRTFGRG